MSSMTTRRPRGARRARIEAQGEDYIEVGQGPFTTVTINRHTGFVVVHRFATKEEAQAQLARNIEQDQPLVDVELENAG